MSSPVNQEVLAELDDQNEVEDGYPPRKVLIPAMVAIYLAVFLFAVDRTILGTAIPAISDEFHSFGDISWYEAGFLLPLCILQLSLGRVYTFYSTKWVLITLVFIFEIGSIICATAPTSNALIAGRVISGVGATGIISGSTNLINILLPLRARPKWSGGIGALFGLASILGPLLGGFLTSVTWRWCFWINVPIGGVSLIALVIATPNRPPPLKAADTFRGKINQLDPIGFLLIAPATVCLLLALQWAGIQYPWSDPRVIALFVLSGVFAVAFIATQFWRKDNATVPPKIFFQRSILAGAIASFGIGSLLVIYSFYLPIWFQAIKGDSSQSSGISLLGLLLSTVVFVMFSGIGTSVLGYYTPFMIIGGAISIVGSALISTWEVNTGSGTWIGYEVIAGVGQGLVLQGPNIAAQTVLGKAEAPIGFALLAFISFLGGSISITVCQTLLVNKLVSALEGKVVGFDPGAIVNQGATSLRHLVPSSELPLVLEAYNDSLRSIWYLVTALSALVFIASFGLEWKSVKNEKSEKSSEAF